MSEGSDRHAIRPGRSSDVAWIAALEAAAFGGDAWTVDQLVEEVTGPRRRTFVVEGTAYLVLWDGDDVADVQRLAVAPDARRRGLARSLLGVAKDRRLLLEVSARNSDAIGFYVAEGFVEISRRPRYYRDDSDALVMEWRP